MLNWITAKLAIVGTALLAILGALAYAFSKGKTSESVDEKEKEQKAITKATEIRSEIEGKTNALPEIAPTSIESAPVDSATGKLRNWTRD